MPHPRLPIGLALLALSVAAPTASALQEQPAPAPGAPATPATVFSPDQVIVQWSDDADHGDKVDARENAEVEFQSNLGNREFQLVEVEPGQSTAEAIGELRADPAVAVAERDRYSAPNAIPTDPLFGELWGLRNLGGGIDGFGPSAIAGADVGALPAWERTVGSPSVVVADIDTGYRFEHPDLANVAWDNTPEVNGTPGVDDDGDGIVDDLHGADFVGNNGESPTTDGNPTDEDLLSGGHGVHTAGTIGAQGNNGIGITGVAQNIRIMPLRVCSRFPSLEDSRCPVSSQIAAINYAAAKGAKVANMSLGGTSSSQAQVNALAAAKETLFVISAGNDAVNNDSVHHYPCDYTPQTQASPPVPGAVDNIVCVAATDQADGLASFSDWGSTSVDLGAPGTQILSTYPFTTPFEDTFAVDDFASRWPATGANGGFQRTNESPLASFGMTDVIGDPVANTIRETTSAAVTVPPNGGCKLNQTRRVVLSSGEHYRYSVLLNGVEQGPTVFEPGSTSASGLERRFLELPATFNGGGSVEVRFRFTAGSSPAAGTGVWLDDISIVCSQAVGQASGYEFLQGTSMAAPHVTGAAGLLFSLKPTASVTEVRSALIQSADPTPSLNGKTVSGGRLDIPGAMNVLLEEPPAPVLNSTVPASPASETHPLIVGAAEDGSTVKIFEGPSCAGTAVASGTADELASPGIEVSAGSNSTTQFTATATNAASKESLCSAPISYTNDSDPPAEPTLGSTVPASPASSTTPKIVGKAESGSTVKIFEAPSCAGSPVTSGTAAQLASPGIEVSVGSNSTTQFTAIATDAAGNESQCSGPISYTNDSVSPAAPILSSTVPTSPASSTTPKILGAAEGGSTVRIYVGSGCAGTPTATGTAAELASPGIQVGVPAGSTRQFSATATDAAHNVSVCSAPPISYTNIVQPLDETQLPASNPAAPISPPPTVSCKVPKLAGLSLSKARAALTAAGCSLGKVTHPKARPGHGLPALVVKASSPAAGASSADGVVGLALGPKPKPKKHHH